MTRKKHAEKQRGEQTRPVKPRERTGAAPVAEPQTPPVETPTKENQVAVETELEQLRAELELARAQAAESLDKFLRAKAEAENARRRAERDVANARKYGIERIAAEMLAVRDSLELARTVDIQQENQVALEKMHEGLDLTLKLMDSVFEKFALSVIDPKDQKFDPEKHQAMSMVDSDQVAPGHVVQVIQKGYMLHERLLRPAMVVVASAPSEKNKDADT